MAADEATYNGLAPCIEAGIQAAGEDSLEGRSWELLKDSWDERIKAAKEKISGQ